MKSDGSFTLVECLIVVAILLIMFGLAVPAIRQASRSNQMAVPDLTVTTNIWLHRAERVRVDGHTYLVFERGVVHDEACQCKAK